MPNNTSENNQPALVSMAQQFTGLPMKSLIGGPLMAAAEANHQMALTQIDYLMSTCFMSTTGGKSSSSPNGDLTYTPVMIKMQLTRGGLTETGTGVEKITSTIELPLLTIVPLNALAVDSVDINFVMEVTSSYSQSHSTNSSSHMHEQSSFEGKMDEFLYSVDIKGSVTHDASLSTAAQSHYQKSNHATYNVHVHAGQLPLPPGVGVIIQAFANNISPVEMPKAESS
ncbi:MAG: DUF2589 domain-containing protein [Chloroflexi bacterium]|nr:MAG: DUF2589 domain-containing protein [Chloroflexota bacterium]